MRNHSWKRHLKKWKNRKILSKFRWFEIGTSGLNQNFGSIQARAIMIIFISDFQNSIIFNSGRIKAAWKTVVFCKIVTLLRKWRHCSASFQKYSKVKPYNERQSPYLDYVFYFKSISCLVFAWEHNKKDTFLQYFQTPPNVYIIYESQNRKGWWYAPRYGCCLLPVHCFSPGYCIYWF